MKIEGGTVVKSPWYYRTGTRPVGLTRMLSYVATGILPHSATVRAQVSTTSTLNVYLGNACHYWRVTVAGVAGTEFGSYITFDSAIQYGFSFEILLSGSANNTPTLTNVHHINEFLTGSTDTAYIMTVDGTTGGTHAVNYNINMTLEWFGK